MRNATHFMTLINLIFVVALLAIPVFSGESKTVPDETYDTLVIAHIDGLINDQFGAIDKTFSEEVNINIEYNCNWAEVVVFKLSDSKLSERGDIEGYFRNKIISSIGVVKIEFLFVHTRIRGSSKC